MRNYCEKIVVPMFFQAHGCLNKILNAMVILGKALVATIPEHLYINTGTLMILFF